MPKCTSSFSFLHLIMAKTPEIRISQSNHARQTGSCVWLRIVIFFNGVNMWLGMAGGCPHRFPHDNFSSVYWIFTKLGHMIPLWKGKNPIYFGVIRSKVTITINIIFYHLILYIDRCILWYTHFLFSLCFEILTWYLV